MARERKIRIAGDPIVAGKPGPSMQDQQLWIERLSDLRARGTPCAMVVVTGVKG